MSTLKHIPMDGPTNFRDLGGYRTNDGRRLKYGRVFRADALSKMTARDNAKLVELGVRAIFDLRYTAEREREATAIDAGSNVAIHAVGLAVRPDPSFLDSFEVDVTDRESARTHLLTSYAQYPHLYTDAVARVVSFILEYEGQAVFHCTAGKDRTGFVAAMLLSALDVPRETIYEDYLHTNNFWDSSDRVPDHVPWEVIEPLYTAHREYLATTFDEIDMHFGSVENYLEKEIKLSASDRRRLHENLLE
ncbi:MAG: tyrosine-protein phosphatase [Gammaproteobacteria bacterium]|nr:tyrosine-protein phosphatase [Gammaproteobacteria bacterium]